MKERRRFERTFSTVMEKTSRVCGKEKYAALFTASGLNPPGCLSVNAERDRPSLRQNPEDAALENLVHGPVDFDSGRLQAEQLEHDAAQVFLRDLCNVSVTPDRHLHDTSDGAVAREALHLEAAIGVD